MDVNRDGRPDVVSSGWMRMKGAFWYDIVGGEFKRRILSFDHLPWYPGEKNQNPPPTGAIAVGMKVVIVDLDNDVVAPGKSGLYVFYNVATAPQPRPEHRMPSEDTYPTWIPWYGR